MLDIVANSNLDMAVYIASCCIYTDTIANGYYYVSGKAWLMGVAYRIDMCYNIEKGNLYVVT